MTKLSSSTVTTLGDVPVPTYDRSPEGGVGIVHIGVGNFHRSHQAVYTDQLLQDRLAPGWGICGVGLLAQDEQMRTTMRAQDGLYTVLVHHRDGSLEPRVVGSILEYLFAPEQSVELRARLADPQVRIVSLTVTEGGYLLHPSSGRFEAEHPSVRHDLVSPPPFATAFAFIVDALATRRASGVAPFTVLSCDNLQGNGDAARRAVVGFATLVDPALAAWIEEAVAFPSCMVDRITPATTPQLIERLREEHDIDDAWPVPCEPFTQWVIEDNFPAGRPPWELAGARLVEDVAPYELMKLRLLNAGHQALAYLGLARGHQWVDQAIADEVIASFLLHYLREEAAPTLVPLPGVPVEDYIATLVDRFANPHVRDTLVRLATDGANRMATFTLPTVRENLTAGRSVRLGALMVAAWAGHWERIGRGEHDGPATVPPDAAAAVLTEAALSNDPAAFIEVEQFFGALGRDERFRRAFLDARAVIASAGLAAAVAEATRP